LLLDLTLHHGNGAIQLSEIAERQDISLKYLEQIIKPLKKAQYVKSIRGAKGGYLLDRSPDQITVGEVVALLEGGENICECTENPNKCSKADTCLTRRIWKEAAKAMYERLNAITFSDLVKARTDVGSVIQ